MLDAMLGPGQIVGHYRIVRHLAEGGMGVVYVAEHVHTEERAAIKVLTAEAARKPEIVQRFHNEARAASRLRHDNIVRQLDFGRTSDGPDGQWYIVLEYLDGVPLSKLMASGPMDTRTIVRYIAQAAAGLQAAHDIDIVHRDVKPDNLFVTGLGIPGADERVKLLDFGIAKLREAIKGLKTKSAVLMGTPQYMAPEQLRDSGKIDARADVFALATIVYEMTTGVRPWGELDNQVSIHDVQVHQTHFLDPRNAPIPEGRPRPVIRDAWARVVRKGLDPDPDRRFQSVAAFARALAKAGDGTAWVKDAEDVLREVAEELTRVSAHEDTTGQPVDVADAPPIVRGPTTAPARPAVMAAEIRAPGVPTPIMPGATPLPMVPILAVPALAPDAKTAPAPLPVAPHAVATVVPQAPNEAAPVHVATTPTTLRSAAGQAVAVAAERPRRPRWIVGASIGGVAAVATIAILIAVQRGDEPATQAPANAPMVGDPPRPAPTSALAVVSEPAGAMIFIDDVGKGVAPLNLTVPVDAQVVIRAELDGHATATETVRIGAEPSTVRLKLAAVAVDAGVVPKPVAATPERRDEPDEPRRTSRKRRDREKPPERGDVAGRGSSATEPAAGTSAGSAKRSPTYNPDDLPD